MNPFLHLTHLQLYILQYGCMWPTQDGNFTETEAGQVAYEAESQLANWLSEAINKTGLTQEQFEDKFSWVLDEANYQGH